MLYAISFSLFDLSHVGTIQIAYMTAQLHTEILSSHPNCSPILKANIQVFEGMRTLKMSSKMIERLPTEILLTISEILDIDHPPSVIAFACASKRCYIVASTVLFRTVKVTIADGKQRFQDVSTLEKRLIRDDAFAHVRRMILFSDPEERRYPYLSLHPSERGREDDTELWRHLENDRWSSDWSSSIASVANDEWGPVIRLMGQLTGLADLFWACREQLPLCLLQVLHEKVSRCRLHNSTFDLSSPIGSSLGSSLTSYERTVITSPCLYSIGGRNRKINPSALKSISSLSSPGLRRVYFWWRRKDADIEAAENNTQNPEIVPREFIQVDGPWLRIPIPLAVIYRETSGNFSAMRALKLNVPLAPQGLPAPTDFPSLVDLTFTCVITAYNTSPQYWDEVITLLRNIPRLTNLQIKCWNRAISFIPSLSPNLRKLDLSTWLVPGGPRLRDDHIHQLADICPNLEHLTLEIRRSRGDATEVARYRSLGRLPRLQELHICLDVSPPGYVQNTLGGNTTTIRDTAIEPWFDEQDAKYLQFTFKAYREGHVRDVLVNSAIDASLARSIFEVISGAKPGRSPGRAAPLPLERLELRARGGSEFVDAPFGDSPRRPLNQFLAALERAWRVERDVRDDSPEVINVKELSRGLAKDPRHSKLFKAWKRNGFPRTALLDNVKNDQYWFGLWRRVWPVETPGMHWWDDWESHPLEL